MYAETWLKTDLKKPIRVKSFETTLFSGDDDANLVGVEVYSDGEAVALTGSIYGYVIRGDGATVVIEGTKSANKASVLLSESCYVIDGPISVVIKEDSTTIGAVSGIVYRSTTDTIVDPANVVPSLADLLAQIDACEQATRFANEKAMSAMQQAAAANNAAQAANGASSSITNMTVAATIGSVGATISTVNNHKHIDFTLPIPNLVGHVNVTTLAYTEDATASITGDVDAPYLNLGIPRGEPGEISNANGMTIDISGSDTTKIKTYIDNRNGSNVDISGSDSTDIKSYIDLRSEITKTVTFSAAGTQTISDAGLTADHVLLSYQFFNGSNVAVKKPLADIVLTTSTGSCSVVISDVIEAGSVRLTFGYAPEVV